MREPIQDCGELHEGEKRRGEFLVARADAAVFFDAAEEVFDLMATTVIPAMKPGRLAAAASGRNAAGRVLPPQPIPKRVGVEAFVGHATVVPISMVLPTMIQALFKKFPGISGKAETVILPMTPQ